MANYTTNLPEESIKVVSLSAVPRRVPEDAAITCANLGPFAAVRLLDRQVAQAYHRGRHVRETWTRGRQALVRFQQVSGVRA